MPLPEETPGLSAAARYHPVSPNIPSILEKNGHIIIALWGLQAPTSHMVEAGPRICLITAPLLRRCPVRAWRTLLGL